MSSALNTTFVGLRSLQDESLRQYISDSSHVSQDPGAPLANSPRALQYFGARSIIAAATKLMRISGSVQRDPQTGQPKWAGENPLHLSISHCEGWAAAALSSFPIGIDIEPRDREVTPAVQRIYGEDERLPKAEEGLPPQVVRWTAKEAACKAYGFGLSHSEKIHIDWTQNSQGRYPITVEAALLRRLPDPEVWVSSQQGLVLSICSSRKGFSPSPQIQFI